MEIINKKLEDLKPYENNPRFNDNAVFAFIGFLGILPMSAILSMVAGGTIFEVLYEIIFYPITKFSIKKIKKYIE